VTPEVTAETTATPPAQAPSTAGMTTKVVKGSLWTIVGQVAPLAVSLVTTPFVIRMLGAEGYGVLILAGLIPTYLGFTDFGMGIASTKFASEAYAEGDPVREARIVRTAALISLFSSLPFATVLFVFSSQIASLFNVPENLYAEASLALKFASAALVLNFLNGIFNTPQLTRLRMDLNSLINAGFRILGLIATPFAIYFTGVPGAVFVLMVVSFITLAGHLYISKKLSGHLFDMSIDRGMFKPMLKFGLALTSVGAAGLLLFNAEKGIVAASVSPTALAYYSVGFTLASMMVLFSNTLIQSLLPAFSQLSQPEFISQLELLFARIVKLILIILFPSAAFLGPLARTFFRVWAGEDFAYESTPLFYVLLLGLLFSVPGYIPYSYLMSQGKASIIARLYWLELIPYLIIVYLLTNSFGIIGSAIAWSARVAFDGVVFFLLAKKHTVARIRVFGGKTLWLPILGCVFVLPILLVSFFGEMSLIFPISLYFIGTIIYACSVWVYVLTNAERNWLLSTIKTSILFKPFSQLFRV
jgi:O-antigen/teichoic acid export membrane protein